MQYTERINKLCELYDKLQFWPPSRINEYSMYRSGDYFSFEKDDELCIDRYSSGKINFTTNNPKKIHTQIESLLKHFEESYNSFIQK